MNLLAKIRRDHKKLRSLKGGGKRLPRIDLSVDHDPIHRRRDLTIVQIRSGVFPAKPEPAESSPPRPSAARLTILSSKTSASISVSDKKPLLRAWIRFSAFQIVGRLFDLGLDPFDLGFAGRQHRLVTGDVGFEKAANRFRPSLRPG